MSQPNYKIEPGENGKWRVRNTKTGKLWEAQYQTAQKAYNALKGHLRPDPSWVKKLRQAKKDAE